MPTTFIGLFLFSTALSLIATFTVLAVLAVVRLIGRRLGIQAAERIGRR